MRGHTEILETIRARKPKAAREGMRAHLRQVLVVVTGEPSGGDGSKPAEALKATDAAP